MTRKALVVVFSIAIVVVCALAWLRPRSTLQESEPRLSGSTTSRSDALGKSSSLPARTGNLVGVVESTQPPSLQTVRTALSAAPDLMQLRDALATMPGVTLQDRLYYAAAIDEYCYGIAAAQGWIKADKVFLVNRAAQNPTFERPVAPDAGDPKQAYRQHARMQLASTSGEKVCAAYRHSGVSLEDLMSRWQRAAAAGDLRSQASLSDLALRQAARPWKELTDAKSSSLPRNVEVLMPPDPSTAHITELTRALSVGDPSTIISLGATLGQSFEHGQFVFGPAKEALLPGLRGPMWELLACNYGYDCGAANPTLLTACANDGLCELTELESYYRAYRFTPAELSQYERLRPQFMAAMTTGDWSFMQYQTPPVRTQPGLLMPFRRPFRLGR